jgi:hypothetical protein
MKLLSIDVGIKNLAYCLLEHTETPVNANATQETKIISWDVLNLCGNDPNCSENCKKKAKFEHTHSSTFFCLLHAKKSGFIIPSTTTISLKKIKKMKLVELNKVVTEYAIPISSDTVKKDDILKHIIAFMDKKMLQSISGAKANDMDLIQIGISMRDAFDKELKAHIETITHIVIENQISPIANRMKTLQGMIAQYFIMNHKTQISFVSAANKLKGHDGAEADIETDTSSYAARKKEGIKITLKLLNERYSSWLDHFSQHKKKDDLADAFLQGNWFLNKNNKK